MAEVLWAAPYAGSDTLDASQLRLAGIYALVELIPRRESSERVPSLDQQTAR